MKNQEHTSDIQSQLDSVDAVASEPVPAGWSRRNWVQREAIAFNALARGLIPQAEPVAE